MRKPKYYDRSLHFLKYCNTGTNNNTDFNIARVIISHIKNIAGLSLEELSFHSYLSNSSISRFFRKSGYKSFQDFKVDFDHFLMEAKMERTMENMSKFMKYDADKIADILYERMHDNLKSSREKMDINRLNEIVKCFIQSDHILFVGDLHELECFYPFQIDLLCNNISAYLYEIDKIQIDKLSEFDGEIVICFLSVYSEWYYDLLEDLSYESKAKGYKTIMFGQDNINFVDNLDIFYQYGIEGSMRDGYVTLVYFSELLSQLLYQQLRR